MPTKLCVDLKPGVVQRLVRLDPESRPDAHQYTGLSLNLTKDDFNWPDPRIIKMTSWPFEPYTILEPSILDPEYDRICGPTAFYLQETVQITNSSVYYVHQVGDWTTFFVSNDLDISFAFMPLMSLEGYSKYTASRPFDMASLVAILTTRSRQPGGLFTFLNGCDHFTWICLALMMISMILIDTLAQIIPRSSIRLVKSKLTRNMWDTLRCFAVQPLNYYPKHNRMINALFLMVLNLVTWEYCAILLEFIIFPTPYEQIDTLQQLEAISDQIVSIVIENETIG